MKVFNVFLNKILYRSIYNAIKLNQNLQKIIMDKIDYFMQISKQIPLILLLVKLELLVILNFLIITTNLLLFKILHLL